jgi:hypothetical protein
MFNGSFKDTADISGTKFASDMYYPGQERNTGGLFSAGGKREQRENKERRERREVERLVL